MRRTLVAFLASICAIVLLSAAPFAPSSAADGVTQVRGTVRFTQTPPAYYVICLWGTDARERLVGQPFCRTFDEPTYAFPYLRPGAYVVEFSAPGHASQYYGQAPGERRPDFAPRVRVAEGATVDVDFQAYALPVLSGTVTGPDGRPVPDRRVRVIIERLGPKDPEVSFGSLSWILGSTYRVEVEPGTYRVRFMDEVSATSDVEPTQTATYAAEYWPDSPTISGAARIPVTWGTTVTHLDARLGAGGEVRGRVTDQRGRRPGTPLGFNVERRGPAGWEAFLSPTDALSLGTYRTRGLPPGTYRQRLFDPNEVFKPLTTPPVVLRTAGQVVTQDVVLRRKPAVTVDRRPRLTGRAQVGRTLRVAGGAFSPRRATLGFRWYADGRPLRARGASLSLGRRLAGARVKVEVTARAPGHRTRTVTLRTRVGR